MLLPNLFDRLEAAKELGPDLLIVCRRSKNLLGEANKEVGARDERLPRFQLELRRLLGAQHGSFPNLSEGSRMTEELLIFFRRQRREEIYLDPTRSNCGYENKKHLIQADRDTLNSLTGLRMTVPPSGYKAPEARNLSILRRVADRPEVGGRVVAM